MKILFVLKGSALNRGMNTGIENLAWQLAGYGADVHVLAGGSQPIKHGYRFPANVTYHFTDQNGAPGTHVPFYSELRHNHHFDAVTGWIRNIAPLAYLEPIGQKRPRFIANEGKIINAGFLRGLRSRLRSLAAGAMKGNYQLLKTAFCRTKKRNGAQMDAVVAISQAVKASVERVYGVPTNKISVIPRGVDTKFFHPQDNTDRSTLASPPRLLFTGNITKAKGLGDVAEALAMIKQPVEWVLCGNDQGYLQKIQNSIERLDIGHRLLWAGTLYPEALRRQLLRADCFVFCSWSEGLGKSLLEAMSCGLPVIASDIAAFRDVVVHHENGLMVPVNDPGHIAEAINAYLSDPELRIRCGANARETIKQNFDKQMEATAWRRLLNKQIGEG